MGTVNLPKLKPSPKKINLKIESGKKTPNYPLAMQATLRALKELDGIATIHEISEHVIKNEKISETQQSHSQSGDHRTKFEYCLSFARTYLKRIDAIKNPKHKFWTLTETGSRFCDLDELERLNELERLYTADNRKRARKTAEKRKNKKQKSESDNNDMNLTIEADELDDAINLDHDWKTALLKILKSISSGDFEILCKILLTQADFSKVKLMGKVTDADGGIDGSGILEINLVSFHVCFQCKRWADATVRANHIRDFRGALQGRADKGLFITTSNFTNDAITEATRDGALTIDLINGTRLCDLLKKYEIDVKPQKDKTVYITKNDVILTKFTLPKPKPKKPTKKETQK